MTDLRTLLWPNAEPGAVQTHGESPSTGSETIRALVGPSTHETVRPVPKDNLRDLVGDASAEPATAPPDLSVLLGPAERHDSSATAAPALSALVGAAESRDAAVESKDLSALVGAPTRQVVDSEGWRAPELAQVGARPLFGGRRKAGAVNYLSVAAATLAVVALVVTTSFAFIQRATANPADDAMISLREREAELANETKVLQTAADLFDSSVEEAASLADASAPVLAGLSGRVDGSVLGSVESARGALAAAAASAVTISVPAYQRAQIDEKDLADVGKAIDNVRLSRDELPALITDAREARSTIVSAISGYRAQLRSLGTAIESEASKLVAENDSAGSSFQTAVTDTAARVVTAQRAGGDGLAEMPAYAAAVDALRAENARIVALEEAERENSPSRPTAPIGGTGNGGDTGSDSSDSGSPAPQPSQPAPPPDPEPSPEPSQPEPTPDPEPTVPSVPNPDPTAPIEGGTT
ncbi:MAG: outer rane receptor protein mostly Fe transport [Microbacterium sp.]|nr:outer rane receptor protein mostly Fe transport [Microbacterium sp.]